MHLSGILLFFSSGVNRTTSATQCKADREFHRYPLWLWGLWGPSQRRTGCSLRPVPCRPLRVSMTGIVVHFRL